LAERRNDALPFFRARHVDNVILNCYRLAKEYGQDPEVFLNKPFSDIDRHCNWTDRLYEGDRIEAAWQAKLNE
jgi:hypothetical protein